MSDIVNPYAKTNHSDVGKENNSVILDAQNKARLFMLHISHTEAFQKAYIMH